MKILWINIALFKKCIRVRCYARWRAALRIDVDMIGFHAAIGADRSLAALVDLVLRCSELKKRMIALASPMANVLSFLVPEAAPNTIAVLVNDH